MQWIKIAAVSRSCSASAARACDAGVRPWSSPSSSTSDDKACPPSAIEDACVTGGIIRRTISSFMCGMADVATASNVGSMGESAIEDGVMCAQLLASATPVSIPRHRTGKAKWRRGCSLRGARFCFPRRFTPSAVIL